jgi:hypothetical protein
MATRLKDRTEADGGWQGASESAKSELSRRSSLPFAGDDALS